MHRKLYAISLVCLLSWSGLGAKAMEEEGTRLHRSCAAEGAAEQRACLSALARHIERLGESDRFCLPNGYEIGQIRDAFLTWAADHPESIGIGAPALVRQVLEDEFPCSD